MFLLIMASLKASDFQYCNPPRNSVEVLTGLNCYACKRPAYQGFIHSCGAIRCGGCDINHLCSLTEENNWMPVSVLPEAMRKNLETIQVVCPFERCKFVGTRTELIEHKASCDFAQQVCFNCNLSMPRKAYGAHLRSCIPSPCMYCSKTVPPAELKVHEQDLSQCLGTTDIFNTLKHPQVIRFLQEALLVSPPFTPSKKRKAEKKAAEEEAEEEEEEEEMEEDPLKKRIMQTMGTRGMKKMLSAHKIRVPKDSNKEVMADFIVEAVKNKKIKLGGENIEEMNNEEIEEKLLSYQYDHLTRFIRSQGLSLTATGMNKQKLAQHMVQQFRSLNLDLKLLFAKPVVHTILEHRGEAGNYEYFVDWKDLDEPSWQPEAEVDAAVVRNYWAELRNQHQE